MRTQARRTRSAAERASCIRCRCAREPEHVPQAHRFCWLWVKACPSGSTAHRVSWAPRSTRVGK
eukprot:2030941-Rhodomonas_salina.1